MSKRQAATRRIDWDAWLTLGLTLGVLLLTGGAAWLFALRRVVRTARAPGAPVPGATLLLVPGKRLVNDRPDADFAARLRCAARLAAAGPQRPIIVLGGLTGAAGITEAAAGERFLRALPQGQTLRIEGEAASQDTLTNLRNLRELRHLLGGQAPAAPLTLVSNRYHLARLGLIADSLGIDHRLYPAEAVFVPTAALWRRLFQESLFYLWFRVGKGWATLTGNRRMLARVT